MSSTIVIDSPVGHLALTERNSALTHCRWTQDACHMHQASALLLDAVQQLAEYFNSKRKIFTIPLNPQGTAFQQAIWQALRTIPYGQTCSYQQLAIAAGHINAHRAAGSANGKNPLCIIIPCHRVILASGQLGGFTGDIVHKKWLLALEAQR